MPVNTVKKSKENSLLNVSLSPSQIFLQIFLAAAHLNFVVSSTENQKKPLKFVVSSTETKEVGRTANPINYSQIVCVNRVKG